MYSSALACIMMIASAPPTGTVRDTVDLIELNHYHDESGRHVFDQLIFYDWNARQGRFEVRAWRMVKGDNQLPRRDYQQQTWRVIWHDGGLLRTVEAPSYRETWTQYDPELVNRAYLPQEDRQELTKWPSSTRLSLQQLVDQATAASLRSESAP